MRAKWPNQLQICQAQYGIKINMNIYETNGSGASEWSIILTTMLKTSGLKARTQQT